MEIGTPRHGRRTTLALSVLALGVLTVLAPTAFAAPTCTGSVGAGSTYTCLPSGSGSVQVTIPARVTSISVTADGGGGGKNASLGNGGSGARASSTIAVTPGAVLTIYVGAGGGAGLGGSGNVGGTGYSAGGNGGPYYGEGFGGGYGGGGGGSSAVLVGGTVAVIAGGGGGGGNYYGGSASATVGAAGGNGGGTCAVGGGGGNAAGSGSAGSTSGTGNSYPGSSSGFIGQGGTGIYGAGGASSGGGGGGGGYGGGGGGNWNGPGNGCTLAGGGGSGGSYGPGGTVFGTAANAGGVATSGAGGDGQVLISFTAPAATVPNAPTDLIFSDVTPTTMTAYWTPPADDGGSSVIGYDVTVNAGPPTRVTSPAIDLTGLTGGSTYAVAVTAVNAVGSSATALTGSQTTSAPGTPTGPATNLVFSGVTSSSITASWTAPTPVGGWPTLGYQVRVDGGTLTWSAGTIYTASGLAPGTTHSFSITVVNGAGTSSALTGNRATLATVPDAPTALLFSGVTSTAITASWTPPTNTGGSAILKYTVSVDGGATVDVVGTTYTATSLTSSAWHTFSILAVNAIGVSASDLFGAASTSAPPGSPQLAATSATVGSPSTVTLTGFTAFSTQTVQVTAPDGTMSFFTVTVGTGGTGTGTYTPSQAGAYSLVTTPAATSTTFTATAASTPTPSDSGAASADGGTSTGGSTTRAAASIRIVGRAGTGRRTGRITVTGTTTGLAGTRVVAHVRLAGSSTFVVRGTALVDARGRFTWQGRATRSASVYFTGASGGRSNRLTIVVRRA
jgi:hypothetical protein